MSSECSALGDVYAAGDVAHLMPFADLELLQDMRRTMLTETLERRTKRTPTPEISATLMRVKSEYLEMPGLKLTEAQARRLWGLDGNTCAIILATLIKRGFLRRAANGTYVRVA